MQDLRVKTFTPLPSPKEIRELLPVADHIQQTVKEGRDSIRSALRGKDKRFVVITGPCSIHDSKAAIEYAHFIKEQRESFGDKLVVIMRVYFEKPRTTVGWKGLINDPHMDASFDIVTGLKKAREILLEINSIGVPCATEFLDPIVPQYTSDLVCWAAIGARTTESQTHREMASGLSMPVGFKNSTSGGLSVAENAMVSASSSHAFLGLDENGQSSIVKTSGNDDVHLVLRGGRSGPNYKPEHIKQTKELLAGKAHPRQIMIDCSHGNSNKDYTKQPDVFREVVDQFVKGEQSILGAMLESHINAGKQSFDKRPLKYGISLTDGCIDIDTTKSLFRECFGG